MNPHLPVAAANTAAIQAPSSCNFPLSVLNLFHRSELTVMSGLGDIYQDHCPALPVERLLLHVKQGLIALQVRSMCCDGDEQRVGWR